MSKEFYIIVNSLFDDSSFGYGEQISENFNTGKAQFCEGCNLPVSMLEWLPPYEIKVSKKELGDFIFGTYTGFINSMKFKVQYEQSNLTGLSGFKEVDVYHKKKKISESFFYPNIPLINAFVNLELIKFEDENLCDICQKGSSILNHIYSVVFVNPEMIKEDIFFTTALGQAHIFVSEKFKEFIDAARFKNIKLLKASDFEWDSLNPIEY